MRYFSQLILMLGMMVMMASCSHAEEVKYSPKQMKKYSGSMGFTPWPYDLTERAVDETCVDAHLHQRLDLILHQCD